jgi:hypothetical protein
MSTPKLDQFKIARLYGVVRQLEYLRDVEGIPEAAYKSLTSKILSTMKRIRRLEEGING